MRSGGSFSSYHHGKNWLDLRKIIYCPLITEKESKKQRQNENTFPLHHVFPGSNSFLRSWPFLPPSPEAARGWGMGLRSVLILCRSLLLMFFPSSTMGSTPQAAVPASILLPCCFSTGCFQSTSTCCGMWPSTGCSVNIVSIAWSTSFPSLCTDLAGYRVVSLLFSSLLSYWCIAFFTLS